MNYVQIDCRASLRYNYYIEIEVEFHLHEWSLFAKSNLFNTYGVNAYDWTPAGDELIQRTDKEAKKELVNLVASAVGTFTGAVISQIADAA